MAKNKIEIDVKVDDKGTTKKVALEAKKAAKGLDETAKSAGTADRNLKGAAQASANSTKNFSKMAQGISTGLVPAYATLAANVFALSAAFNFLKNAADIANLEKSQVAAAQNTGVAMDRLTSKLREASKGMLNFQDAAAASATGVAKGFSALQMENLAEGALKVSNVMGRDFKDSFDRLVRGVSKAEPELLDELGVTLRLETAKQRYADALNKNVKALTDAERSQAVYLETMRQLEQVTKGQEGVANPFIQLGATFSDIIKDLTQFFLPVLEGIANFLNKNAAAALLFFTVIGASIVKSLPFIDSMKDKFNGFVSSQKQGLVESKQALEAYRQKLKEVQQSAAQRAQSGAAAVQSGARQAISGGAQSRVLMKAALGTMGGTDRANLKKALAAAEKDYLQHGKITKGIFKNLSIDIVRSMDKGFKDAATKATTGMSKISRAVENVKLRAKIASSSVKLGFTSAFALAGKAAAGFGRAMNMAMKATVILGIIQMIYDMVMALVNAPYTVLKGIVGVGKGALNMLQGISNLVIDMINYIIAQVNKLPIVQIDTVDYLTFADEINSTIDQTVENLEFVQKLKAWEAQRNQALAYSETLKGIKDEIPQIQKSLTTILSGKVFDQGDENYDPMKESLAAAKAISSLGIEGLFNEALTIKDPEKKKQALSAIAEGFTEDLKKLSPAFAKAVEEGNAEAVRSLTAHAGSFTANVADVSDKLNNLQSIMDSQGNALGVRLFIENLQATANAAVSSGSELGFMTDILDRLNEAFKDQGGVETYIQSLKKVEDETRSIAQARNALEINRVRGANAPGAVGRQQSLRFGLESEELALREKLNALQEEQNKIFTDPAEQESQKIRLEGLQREIDLQREKTELAKRNLSEVGQIGNAIGDSLASSMQSAFDGLIQGTMTAKEAFANMAQSMLQAIAKVIAELLVAKILTAALGGGSGFGAFLGIPAGRYGGVMEQARSGGVLSQGKKMPGYSMGGVARGSDAGYPAMLHGTEAVVPLPNGRSIPVDMKGAGQQNNVTVNVSVDSNGNAQQNSQSDGQQGANLGNAIAAAVQKELQNQKRSGGILNPYGVA